MNLPTYDTLNYDSFNHYQYLTDYEFLQELSAQPIREETVKITLLDWQENPIKSIEGVVTSGSINIDGQSAMRRTANLSVVITDDIIDYTELNYDFSINKKVNIEIGITNKTNKYSTLDIVWFPMGLYIIQSISISRSESGVTIQASFQDKMCLLNGSCGGRIPATTYFDQLEETDEDGNVIINKVPIYNIIQEIVTHFGGEQLSKIIISDVDLKIKQVMKWNGKEPVYIKAMDATAVKSAQSAVIVGEQSESKEEELLNVDSFKKYEYNDDVGYIYTDFVYPGELVGDIGSSCTDVLDKIRDTLGNYEYFYDLFGNFVFREKKNFLNTRQTTVEVKDILNNLSYCENTSRGSALFRFDNSNLISSYSNNPNYAEIKNDFVVWGKKKGASGEELPIRYHLAIDKKPDYFLDTSKGKEYHTRWVMFKDVLDIDGNVKYSYVTRTIDPKNQSEQLAQLSKIVDEIKDISSVDPKEQTRNTYLYSLYASAIRVLAHIENAETKSKYFNGWKNLMWDGSLGNNIVPIQRDGFFHFYYSDWNNVKSICPIYTRMNVKEYQEFYTMNLKVEGNQVQKADKAHSEHLFKQTFKYYDDLYLKDTTFNPDEGLYPNIILKIKSLIEKIKKAPSISTDYTESIERIVKWYNDVKALCNNCQVSIQLLEDFINNAIAALSKLKGLINVCKYNDNYRDYLILSKDVKQPSGVDVRLLDPIKQQRRPTSKEDKSLIVIEGSDYSSAEKQTILQRIIDYLKGMKLDLFGPNGDNLASLKLELKKIDDLISSSIQEMNSEYISQLSIEDWRTALYIDGIEADRHGTAYNSYYIELINEWPKLYDLKDCKLWTPNLTENQSLDYFLDFIDKSSLSKYCVSNIGTRSEILSDDTINCIFEPIIPNLIWINTNWDDTEKRLSLEYCNANVNSYYQASEELFSCLTMGGTYNSAYNRIQDLLYQKTVFNETISLQTLPLFFLEPNIRIHVKDQQSGINGDYVIQSLSIPLGYSAMMSINANVALDRI